MTSGLWNISNNLSFTGRWVNLTISMFFWLSYWGIVEFFKFNFQLWIWILMMILSFLSLNVRSSVRLDDCLFLFTLLYNCFSTIWICVNNCLSGGSLFDDSWNWSGICLSLGWVCDWYSFFVSNWGGNWDISLSWIACWNCNWYSFTINT